VHTPALTALYFPAALRNATNRAATVTGDAASAAVRAGLLRGTPATEAINHPTSNPTP
jgi:hypothetical protein